MMNLPICRRFPRSCILVCKHEKFDAYDFSVVPSVIETVEISSLTRPLKPWDVPWYVGNVEFFVSFIGIGNLNEGTYRSFKALLKKEDFAPDCEWVEKAKKFASETCIGDLFYRHGSANIIVDDITDEWCVVTFDSLEEQIKEIALAEIVE